MHQTTASPFKRDALLAAVFLALTVGLYFLPTGFEHRTAGESLRCRGEILSVDNEGLDIMGLIRIGSQELELGILDGPFAGEVFKASNQLQGRMDLDKLYQPGDTALTVLSLDGNGEVIFVNAQDHYRIGLELGLLGLFALLLAVFGGWTGIKALLSFTFSGMVLWKILIPSLLKGHDPVLTALGVTALLTGVIIFLVAGLTRMGLVAFLGAMLGVLCSCALALWCTGAFKVHGAVMPFAETLLYSGFPHLDLARIYVAAIFLAASGAVMDLAMDVAASMNEVLAKRPDMSRMEALRSGLTVGRAVVGTMTTTLLLAYSGGFITLLMAFMAQGVPMVNMFNLIYVAAEVVKTLVGSFGLVTVAPFTALAGAFLLVRPAPAREFARPAAGSILHRLKRAAAAIG